MALIQCPECRQQVSDQAIACPHCGYSMAYAMDHPVVEYLETRRKNRNTLFLVLLTLPLVACAIVGIVLFLLYMSFPH